MLLLFSEDVGFGNDTARKLREKGFPVVSHDPDFALSICEKLDFSGVILDGRSHADRFERLSEQLFERYPDLPISFVTSPSSNVFPCASEMIWDSDEDALFDRIFRFCKTCMGQENYSTYALQHFDETKSFTYLGYPLPLSDYEYRFLLSLFRGAPNAVKADDILSEAFPSSRTPQSTLWTLAKRINQASKAISGLKLVQCAYGTGYRLCGGIVKQPTTERKSKKKTLVGKTS